ncbi:MAG: TonB-dependent receptor [Bacteroidales bacterium]|nr:TonB-dependent receptor [Bacteroidales bacterium]
MKRSFVYCILLAIMMLPQFAFAQKYTISGYIKDKATGEDLIGANVMVAGQSIGTSANGYGFYSLTLPGGTYDIIYSFIGYSDDTIHINLTSDKTLTVQMSSSAIMTQEVVVSAERKANVQSSQMSVVRLPVETVKTLPAFMGEVDVLKTIQLMPGVQSAGDGNAGFYVRGGGPDQNLILLDEATVYNASHLFGFFSVFNADAVKDMEMFKGGMPAEYGGRISSVLNISMKNGNMKEYHIEGGIGSVSSRFTVQGPIVKDKASFIVSARRTYIDALIRPFTKKTSLLRTSGYYFFDVNAKANWIINDNNRLYLSGYYGYDKFRFGSKEMGLNMNMPWGNGFVTLRHNHVFNNKFFSNTSLIWSNYKFNTSVEMLTMVDENAENNENASGFAIKQKSGINDWNLKQDFTWLAGPKNTVKFGVQYTHHKFTPNTLAAEISDTTLGSDFSNNNNQFAHEVGIYIGDDFKINDRFTLYLGVRNSYFVQVGPFTRYIKDELHQNTIDEIRYKDNQPVAFYWDIEPRASFKVSITENSSIKASYMRNSQYIHLASISATTLPIDLWVACSDVVKPQKGSQYALGYFQNLFNDKFEGSIEVYYKTLQNQIEYMDGALPGDDISDNADNYFIFGKGYSYGVEFFFKKRVGLFTGWIGYTWSKTDKIFDDIDNGNPFPAKYDRRHDLSVTATYQITERLTASAVFVYATGNTTTLPVASYMIDGDYVNVYGSRNSYRMPAYHRLDLSVTYDIKTKKNWESSFNFSIYNVYNHKNPYFIYVYNTGNVKDGTYKTVAKQLSIIPILPAITWNFKF